MDEEKRQNLLGKEKETSRAGLHASCLSMRLGVPGNCTETSLEIFTCIFFFLSE